MTSGKDCLEWPASLDRAATLHFLARPPSARYTANFSGELISPYKVLNPRKFPPFRRTIQKFLWYDVIPQQMPLVKLFAPSSSIWLREPRLSIVLPAVSALRDASNPKSPMNFGRSLIIFRQLRLTGHRRSFSVSVSLLLND